MSAAEYPPEYDADADIVRQGIQNAVRDRKGISDGIARIIATSLHTGHDSAMCYFAVTGGIMEDLLVEEIGRELNADRLDADERTAARFLGLYALRHGDRPRQPDWDEV